METTVYNSEGKETGKIKLPKEVFGLPWNADLVHQVAVSMQSNAREPIAHTKNRGEVSGGGIKPWRQKGTGRARHGSSRSPIWVGGGITHGPRNDKNFEKKINKKMKTKAFFTILSKKFKDGEVLFVEKFALQEPKAKLAKGMLTSMSKIEGFKAISTRKNAAYITVSEKTENVEKSFRNFNNVEVDEVRNVNPLDLLTYKYLVISNPQESIKVLQKKLESKKAKTA
jgi:large subunit ribosomal protein L4